MNKQRTLPLTDQAALESLWEHFPEPNRDELVKLYAQLIARVAVGLSRPVTTLTSTLTRKESVDERTHR